MAIYSSNIKIMISAINSASKAVLRDFNEINKLQNSHNVSGVRQFTEVAYNKSKTIIEAELQRFRPDFSLCKEEGKQYYWNICPINGKYNFSRAIPFFSISITLMKGNEVIAVIIIIPASGELFWAEKGVGAYINHHGNTNKVRLHSKFNKDSQYIVVGLSGMNGRISRAIGSMQYRIIGSIDVNIAYVLTGKIDALVYMKGVVDNSLLIKEALGSIVCIDDYCIAGDSDVVSMIEKRLLNE